MESAFVDEIVVIFDAFMRLSLYFALLTDPSIDQKLVPPIGAIRGNTMAPKLFSSGHLGGNVMMVTLAGTTRRVDMCSTKLPAGLRYRRARALIKPHRRMLGRDGRQLLRQCRCASK
jgi:hypothetical protein